MRRSEDKIPKIVECLEFYGDTTELGLWGAEAWKTGWTNEDRHRFLEEVAFCLVDVLDGGV